MASNYGRARRPAAAHRGDTPVDTRRSRDPRACRVAAAGCRRLPDRAVRACVYTATVGDRSPDETQFRAYIGRIGDAVDETGTGGAERRRFPPYAATARYVGLGGVVRRDIDVVDPV